MLGKEFRGLAETVTRTYGENPWFFLRELAQNSRDAGARNIWVEAEHSEQGEESIRFADDGRGMTLAYARRFLFRLYASEKTADHKAAGKYGIGFWTLLGFQPSRIFLQSRRGRTSWAVELDGELNIREATCNLSRSGTSVALSRPAAFASPGEFKSRLESELQEYCQYLRRNDRRASLLPVWFEGKNFTRRMTLPGPLSYRFRSGTVEGAVGLAEKPHVRLYARGLPVWQGAVLKQMTHLQMDEDGQAEIGRGLAPVFLLNGNRLDVTFSRNLALENRALENVRKKAEQALRHLLELSLERTFPRTWRQRGCDRLLSAWKWFVRPGWHWLALLLLFIVPLEIALLRQWFPGAATVRAIPFSLQTASLSYNGATVAFSDPRGMPRFSYQPGVPAWFRLFAAETYDPQSGFVRRNQAGRLPASQIRLCGPEDSWSMQFQARAGGEIFLPLPPGHRLLSGSVRLDGRPIVSVISSIQGESIAVLADQGGNVEYRSCPGDQLQELTAAEILRLTFLPRELSHSPVLEAVMREALPFPIAEKAAFARSRAGELVAYDTSQLTAGLHSRRSGDQPWLEKVMGIGKGDCDVINGLHVLFLRKMGIPSRLVIGMIGEQGRVRPLLHAWCEYFDRGWRISDASAGRPADPLIATAGSPDRTGYEADLHSEGSVTEGSLKMNGFLAPALLLLALAAAAGLLLVKKNKGNGEAILPSAVQIKKQLMQLVEQAMLQPEIWGRDNPLWSHRILPAVKGKSVSIRQALRLIGRNKLFITANRNPLATAMAESGMTVVDLSQEPYARLRTLLAGAVDADMLCRLRPVPPQPAAAGLDGDLLASTNRFLGKTRRSPVPCLLTPGLDGSDLLTIALPAPLRHSPFFFPPHFVAVNPAGATFRHLSSLYGRNRILAVFQLLRRLHTDRLHKAVSTPARLKQAARRLLRTCP